MFFQPTLEGRGWIVNPFRNDWFWIFAGLPPALLATILIFMDQQITSVIVNRKENKLLVSIAASPRLLLLKSKLFVGIAVAIGCMLLCKLSVSSAAALKLLTVAL